MSKAWLDGRYTFFFRRDVLVDDALLAYLSILQLFYIIVFPHSLNRCISSGPKQGY